MSRYRYCMVLNVDDRQQIETLGSFAIVSVTCGPSSSGKSFFGDANFKTFFTLSIAISKIL